MITNSVQNRTYAAVAKALPVLIGAENVSVVHGTSYIRSRIKAHDYAAGVMAAYGSVVDHLGVVRGLPRQTLELNRRLCGLLLNGIQLQYLNGYCTLMDTWPVGPDNGTYRAKDGRYVTMIGLHPHLRDGLLRYFDCANTAEAIQAAVEKKTAQQIEDEVAEINLPLGMVRSAEEWLDHPQGRATAACPMIDISPFGKARNRVLGDARHRPLEGVRVVEMTHLIAGPTISRLLAEQGAEVIKIQPPMGDWITPLWLDVSWGKKNIMLDVKTRRGKQRLAELLADADVLVSSQRPGALERLGFGDEALRALNPCLVYASASYAPPGTPWENRRGLEQIAQTVTGMIHTHSQDLDEPSVMSVLINDYLTGYLGAIGTVAALVEREHRGGFWRVDVSLMRCAMEATTLLEPLSHEEYAPVTLDDLVEHAVDQVTPWGVFTRLGPAVKFSHTPSMFVEPAGWPNGYPDTIRWSQSVGAGAPAAPHFPSRLAREKAIRNLVECYGIVDRADGRGGFSLASKALAEYMVAHRDD